MKYCTFIFYCPCSSHVNFQNRHVVSHTQGPPSFHQQRGSQIFRWFLEIIRRLSPEDTTLRQDFCMKVVKHLIFCHLVSAVLSMEDPSIILLEVASHQWSLPLLREKWQQAVLKLSPPFWNRCTFKAKCSVWFTRAADARCMKHRDE